MVLAPTRSCGYFEWVLSYCHITKYIIFLFCLGWLAHGAEDVLKSGAVIPVVACADNPKQTYALYLPSNFSVTRSWPIIYVFDAAARGQLAVETIYAAAEKFGYIVAASNNSKNGPMGGAEEAAHAMWDDTHRRFPINEHRHYFSGMSGGARVAAGLALSCGQCAAGVIANAAGFPVAISPPRDMKFAYYATVGNADFNYPEFVMLRKRLNEAEARYDIRVFEGAHEWAPPEVWLEALNWMDLDAMSTGVLPRDPQRIQESLHREMEKAQQLLSQQNLLAAFRQYQSVARTFGGLTDVTAAKEQLAGLSKEKAFKRAEREEQDALDHQAQLTEEPSAEIQQIASGGLSMEAYTRLRSKLADFKKQAASTDANDAKSLALRRAVSALVVEAFEAGQRSVEMKKYEAALLYFDLTIAGSRYPQWSHYQRARIYAVTSNAKGVVSELKLAIAAGLQDASALESEEFHAYRDLPQFQELAAELKRESHP
jgi:hypothetical protein